MLFTLTDLAEQQRAIQSFQVGLQKRQTLLAALNQVEHGQNPDLNYQIEHITPEMQRITVQLNQDYQMQSVIKNGKRISLRIIRD